MFTLYGDKYVLVGHLPTTFDNIRQERHENSPEVDLMKPRCDFPILCEEIDEDFFDDSHVKEPKSKN